MSSVVKSEYNPMIRSQKVDTISPSKQDWSLCVTNILSYAPDLLQMAGVDGTMLVLAKDLGSRCFMMSNMYESIAAFQKDGVVSALPGMAFSAARLFISYQMQTQPLLKPVALLMNAYTAYTVIQRAYTGISRSLTNKQATGLQVLENVFVHGVNTSSVLHRTASIFDQVRKEFFPSALRPTPTRTNEEEIDEILKFGKEFEDKKDKCYQKTVACSPEELKELEEELGCKIFDPVCDLTRSQRQEPLDEIYKGAKGSKKEGLQFRLHPDQNKNNKDKASKAFQYLGQGYDALNRKRGPSGVTSQKALKEEIRADTLSRAREIVGNRQCSFFSQIDRRTGKRTVIPAALKSSIRRLEAETRQKLEQCKLDAKKESPGLDDDDFEAGACSEQLSDFKAARNAARLCK